MLAFPGFTRSLVDAILDDDCAVHQMEFLMPRGGTACQQGALSRKEPKQQKVQYATPTIKDDKFSLSLDLHQFAPEEVQVQFGEDRMLRVTGRKEVKSEDGSSYEFREYSHHFSVPEEVIQDQLKVKLDKTGHLSIQGPVKVPEKINADGSKSIPIEFVAKQ